MSSAIRHIRGARLQTVVSRELLKKRIFQFARKRASIQHAFDEPAWYASMPTNVAASRGDSKIERTGFVTRHVQLARSVDHA